MALLSERTVTGIIARWKLSFRGQARKKKNLKSQRKDGWSSWTWTIIIASVVLIDSFSIGLLRLVSSAVNIMSHHWTCKPVCRWRTHYPGKERLPIGPHRQVSADPAWTMSPWEHWEHLYNCHFVPSYDIVCVHNCECLYNHLVGVVGW